MKRNNLLLISYILFIFICLIVRSFIAFESWSAIVSAIALSSACMAYADLFYLQSKAYSEACDIEEKFSVDMRRRNDEENSIVADMQAKLSNAMEINGDRDYSSLKTDMDEVEQQVLSLDGLLDDFEEEIAKKRKNQKRYNVIGDVFTCASFLLFLCIISFAKLEQMAADLQERISVIAFVIILSSQYLGLRHADDYEKEKERLNELSDNHEDGYKKFVSTQKNFIEHFEKVSKNAN